MQKHIGIHLSGSNANKTALVILALQEDNSPPIVDAVHVNIGSFGSVFSDDRILWILTQAKTQAPVYVDCPMSYPPCVSCERPVCPGVIACEDLKVAWMLAIATRKKRKKPINPQVQRLWDIWSAQGHSAFGSTMISMVTRARTLEKRLRGLPDMPELRETSIPSVMAQISKWQGFPANAVDEYRHFEKGLQMRSKIIQQMQARGFVQKLSPEHFELVTKRIEAFQAFICAWVAVLGARDGLEGPPEHFIDSWVWLPFVGQVERV